MPQGIVYQGPLGLDQDATGWLCFAVSVHRNFGEAKGNL